MPIKKIYLDYAATTPLAPEVKKAMEPYWNKYFGNPMAQHFAGEEARKAIEMAREQITNFFNVDHEEIIFTSGATESNNLAIKGVARAVIEPRNYAVRGKPLYRLVQGKPL